MKTILKYAFLSVWIIILSFGVVYAQPDTLTIIHVNDTHSNLDPYGAGKYGGIARAASVIGYWNMTEPNPVLVHAGDFMVGTLMFNRYFGVPELQILSELGFDAMVLGNHEFDVGPLYLAGILTEGLLDPEFHILGTNVKNLDQVPELEPFVKASVIKEFGGVKVGFIGLTTPAANVQSNPQPLYIDDNLVEIAMLEMMALRSNGADVVLIVSHLGIAVDMLIANYLSGIDAIIGGHSHTPLHDVVYVNNIPIVHAGEFYSYVGKLRLVFDGATTSVLDYVVQPITDAIPEEPTVAGIIEYLKFGVIEQYSEILGNPYLPIATANRFLFTEPLAFDILDTPMGNLVTSALFAYETDIDCALEPTGHIVGGGLFEGPVTAAELFRNYPYGYDERDGLGFRLATYYLPGMYIYGMLDELLNFIHPEINDYEYLVQSAGLDYVIYITPDGHEIGEVYINGEPLNPDGLYKVASSDMVVNYMDMLFGLTPPGLDIKDISVFQVVKEYVEELEVLDISADGHNRAVDFTMPAGIVEFIVERVQLFTLTGVLNIGQGNALTVKLDNALKQIARNNYKPAGNQINAFVNQVDAFVKNGTLSNDMGAYLKGLAGRALFAIGEIMSQDNNHITDYIQSAPHRFSLEQNYPNPFNPVTTIRYALPYDTHVRLEVYNILGQCVKVLVDEIQDAGYYAVEFDAGSLSSGIYLYRIEAGGMVEIRSLTVLK